MILSQARPETDYMSIAEVAETKDENSNTSLQQTDDSVSVSDMKEVSRRRSSVYL